MSWNYRIVLYRDGSGYGLHEVYYDDAGQPWGMTKRPASFVCGADEGPKGIVGSLQLALKAANERPVFEEPKKWRGKTPLKGDK